MKRLVRSCVLLIISLVVSFSLISPAYAATDGYNNEYRIRNNIIFYPSGQASQCGAETASGDAGLVGANNIQKIFNYLKSKGLPDVAAAGVAGNINQESSGGTPDLVQGGSRSKDPSNLSAGYGIIQWTPGRKLVVPVDNLKGPDGQVKQQSYESAAGTKAKNMPIASLSTQLEILWWMMEKGGFLDLTKLQSFTSEDQLLAAVTYFHDTIERSADQNMDNRLAFAKNILRKYSDGTAATSPVSDSAPPTAGAASTSLSSGSSSCQATATGDAVKTAVSYAWPEYHAPPYFDMKPAYAEAVKKAQKEGRYVGGNGHPGIDCGGFVSIVMHDSGADINYNNKQGPTTAQRQYMIDHPDKYEEIHPTDSSGVKPGDIAVNGEHTYIYVGKVSGFGKEGEVVASASISYSGGSWRAPMAGKEMPGDPNYSWFRPKSGNQSGALAT